jgi:hypothetical protein
MTDNSRLESQINDVLARWNPVDVPDLIAEVEYESYVNDIISIGKKHEVLATYLNKLVEILGLDLEEGNVAQREEIQKVVVDLLQVLQ